MDNVQNFIVDFLWLPLTRNDNGFLNCLGAWKKTIINIDKLYQPWNSNLWEQYSMICSILTWYTFLSYSWLPLAYFFFNTLIFFGFEQIRTSYAYWTCFGWLFVWTVSEVSLIHHKSFIEACFVVERNDNMKLFQQIMSVA